MDKVEPRWAQQITIATKIHRESQRYRQKYELPRWERGEKWAKQLTIATKNPQKMIEISPNTRASQMGTYRKARKQLTTITKYTEYHKDIAKNTRFPGGNVEKIDKTILSATKNLQRIRETPPKPRESQMQTWRKMRKDKQSRSQ